MINRDRAIFTHLPKVILAENLIASLLVLGQTLIRMTLIVIIPLEVIRTAMMIRIPSQHCLTLTARQATSRMPIFGARLWKTLTFRSLLNLQDRHTSCLRCESLAVFHGNISPCFSTDYCRQY